MPPPMLCRPVFSAGIRKAPCSLNKSFFTPTHHLGLRLNRGPAQRPFAQFARANRALGHPYHPPSRYAPVLLREVAGWYLKVAASGFGLALVFLAAPVMYCDSPPSKTATPIAPTSQSVDSQTPDISAPLPPPPQSIVNLYELTFGTVCGVCAGVFVKKGARAVAFALGGVFVLLQYLGSLSLVRVDWGRAASRFENLFYTKDVSGVRKPPSVASLFRWIIDFLTADFQPRATFIAGFALGLRIG